jgi:hypothetical protein
MNRSVDPIGEIVGTEAELLAEDMRDREARFARQVGEGVTKIQLALSKAESDLRGVASNWPERVARLEGELPRLRARVSAAQEDARLARESAKEEASKRMGAEASVRELREECERLKVEGGSALPAGRLLDVTAPLQELLKGAPVWAAVPSDDVDVEYLAGSYAVGDWVFFLDVEGAMHPEDGIAHQFDPPITLSEADQFAAGHPRVRSIAAVLLGVEDPASVGVVGKCSLYATEEAAMEAQRRFGGERRRFREPVSVKEAVEWCQSDLAAVLASGSTAADWLLEVRGLRLADHRPAGGKLWLFDGPPAGPGERTDNLSSAVVWLRASGFRVKQGSHRKYGQSYFFESSSRDPNE